MALCTIFNQNRSLVSESKIPHSFSLQQCDPIPSVEKVNIIFDNLSSDTCAIKYSKTSNVVLLNFASDKRPGDGYVNGASAQEETLCRSIPYLYPSLSKHIKYPITDCVVVTPSICVIRDSSKKYAFIDPYPEVIVVSASAPRGGTKKFQGTSSYEDFVRKKLKLIFGAAVGDGSRVLILGAWGCGVFQNDARTMVKLMLEACKRYGGNYYSVVFSIPDDTMSLKRK